MACLSEHALASLSLPSLCILEAREERIQVFVTVIKNGPKETWEEKGLFGVHISVCHLVNPSKAGTLR